VKANTQVFSATPLPATVTVHTARGEAYTINVEQACAAVAELHSNASNEARFGWSLNTPWYEAELYRLYALVINRVAPYQPAPPPPEPAQ
jgi:hypothetical protein